jgi:hypothetical protein
MLMSSLQLYERILLGFASDDPEVQAHAQACMSYLVCFLRMPTVSLPDHVVAELAHLPPAVVTQ